MSDVITARQYLEQYHRDWLEGKTEEEVQVRIDELTAKANLIFAVMQSPTLEYETKH